MCRNISGRAKEGSHVSSRSCGCQTANTSNIAEAGVVFVTWLCTGWVAHVEHNIRVTHVMSLVYWASSDYCAVVGLSVRESRTLVT